MKKLWTQFSNLRRSIPRHVQWLLLGAAFIVVLILLTLLLRGRGNNAVSVPESGPVRITVTPSSIDWAQTALGTTESQKIVIAANGPVRVTAVRLGRDMPGLATPKTTCTNIGEINAKISCTISVEYSPTVAADAQQVPLNIDWHGADAPDEMTQTAEVLITLGAVESPSAPSKPEPQDTPAPTASTAKPDPAPAAKPTPAPEPEPEPEPDPEPAEKPAAEPDVAPEPFADIEWEVPADPAPATVKDEIIKNVDSLAPALPMADKSQGKPAKKAEPTTDLAPGVTSETYTQTAEACSDFAFPGYNTSGQQIGWIRPERGAYYFHPFTDKACDTPTGVYNPDNGIITAIDNPAQKIGTDADNIGYGPIQNGVIPELSNPVAPKKINRATQSEEPEAPATMARMSDGWAPTQSSKKREAPKTDVTFGTTGQETVTSTQIYDRTFVLRQYKPIPATIVSDVRADPSLYKQGNTLPVRATVDRNVYSDNGRTVIIPTGTLLLGYLTGTMPGPYTSIGRMEINWYQFILPNGVEFNFSGANDPFSGDAQGRVGVPGRGSTDYLEQFVMPMLTAIVPAAVNMIAPIADKFVNQIDLDNNTVVQSGTVRSSELAKNEIITAWNQVAQKLLVDMMDNTTPPFTIAAGTRITVFSPVDLQVTCGDPDTNPNKKCAVAPYGNNQRQLWSNKANPDYADGSWVGQSRSFNMTGYCEKDENGVWKAKSDDATLAAITSSGYSYSTVAMYCQSMNYQAINNARQQAVYQNQQQTSLTDDDGNKLINNTQKYNEQVLGLTYNEDGTIQNPYTAPVEETSTLQCEDGTAPDANGCCTGEIYTDMGEQGFNCCPESGGDCFPPLI